MDAVEDRTIDKMPVKPLTDAEIKTTDDKKKLNTELRTVLEYHKASRAVEGDHGYGLRATGSLVRRTFRRHGGDKGGRTRRIRL